MKGKERLQSVDFLDKIEICSTDSINVDQHIDNQPASALLTEFVSSSNNSINTLNLTGATDIDDTNIDDLNEKAKKETLSSMVNERAGNFYVPFYDLLSRSIFR